MINPFDSDDYDSNFLLSPNSNNNNNKKWIHQKE